MKRKPDEAEWLEGVESDDGRLPFEEPAALDELRRNAFETVGLPWAIGVLYGVGMGQGLRDGLRLTRAFAGVLSAHPELPGATLPLLFTPAGRRPGKRFLGMLSRSLEARLHLSSYPQPAGPICFVSAGYSAGWYSALFGEFYLVRETGCLARGARECSFEARPTREWTGSEADWARDLLPYLDYEQLLASARDSLSLDASPPEGELLGGFDALSPAAHVWGPVLVLPYSGAEDSLAAVQVILHDLGPDQIRVVIVDVTGVRIDGLEAAGLARLIDGLESLQLESVIVGPRNLGSAGIAGGRRHLSLPLVVADLGRAIALAFQLAEPEEG